MNKNLAPRLVSAEEVVEHEKKYHGMWWNKSDLFWFLSLLEEVVELGLSLLSQYKESHPEDVRRDGEILYDILFASQDTTSMDLEGLRYILHVEMQGESSEKRLRNLANDIARIFQAQYN